jgi:transcription elongation factor Elf1
MKISDNSERENQINAELVKYENKFNCPECSRVMLPVTLDKHKCSCGAKVEQITIFRKGLT